MNLRILKKLSKFAAPLLPLLGDTRKQFPAEKDENFQHIWGHDRKHWERSRAKYPMRLTRDITYRPKDGRGWIVMREPSHPLKGTPMVGSMSGYYEPEWEEETAWESLQRIVFDHFTDWTEDGPTFTRDLSTTRKVIAAARELAENLPQTQT